MTAARKEAAFSYPVPISMDVPRHDPAYSIWKREVNNYYEDRKHVM
jgi:hypothetical protein